MRLRGNPKIDTNKLLARAKAVSAAPPRQPNEQPKISEIGQQLPELNSHLKAAYGGHIAMMQALIDYVQQLERRIQILEKS